jgi:hypothetical protein
MAALLQSSASSGDSVVLVVSGPNISREVVNKPSVMRKHCG